MRQAVPNWKILLDVLLIPVALFRVAVGCSVDVAMAFRFPMKLDGCATACSGALCRCNCQLRGWMHLDLTDYFASGVDPASTALGWPIRLMTGFYFLGVAPFMVVLLLALWTRKEFIRVPAIIMGTVMACMMAALTLSNTFGSPPSTSLPLFLLYNLVDVLAPLLILIRVVPRPLYA